MNDLQVTVHQADELFAKVLCTVAPTTIHFSLRIGLRSQHHNCCYVAGSTLH